MLFFLFRSVRTSKIGDEHIVFNDGENVLCLANWEVLMLVDNEAAARVSGAAETIDYFG